VANLATALFGIASAERLIGVMPRVMISFRNCRLLVVLALWARPYSTYAGVTIDLHELDSLFSEQPEATKGLRFTLEFPAVAWAEVRLGSHFKALGGARMGPYSFKARVRSSNREVEVVLCTSGRFLNSKGEELPESQMFEAARLEEHLVTLLLRDVPTTRGAPSCPP
jgi:hypothetical protein